MPRYCDAQSLDVLRHPYHVRINMDPVPHLPLKLRHLYATCEPTLTLKGHFIPGWQLSKAPMKDRFLKLGLPAFVANHFMEVYVDRLAAIVPGAESWFD